MNVSEPNPTTPTDDDVQGCATLIRLSFALLMLLASTRFAGCW